MLLGTALRKLKKLSQPQLERCIQQCQVDIDNYKLAIRNYDEAKMRKYGLPHLVSLQEVQTAFVNELGKRT